LWKHEIRHRIDPPETRAGLDGRSSEIGLVVENRKEDCLDMKRFSTRFSLQLFFLVTLCFCLASSSWAQADGSSQSEDDQFFVTEQMTPSEEKESLAPEQKIAQEEEEFLTSEQETALDEEKSLTSEREIPLKKKEFLTRGQKSLLLNVGGLAAVFAYGLWKWDYGQNSFEFVNEGWFGRTTEYGGADKLGHYWSSYAMSHLFSYFYRKWGYTDRESNLYGALSNLGFQTFMEIADGFSPSQKFSWQDMTMNVLGSAVGYVWGRYPSLARKIDFRIEYKPYFNSNDTEFSTKYDRQTFLIAVKADGFDFIKNKYLKYLEFQVGYNARGYKDYEEGVHDDRRRTIYVGLGFNVSRLLQTVVNTRIFDYVQIPYTSVRYGFSLDK
jgi:hypothetical protein